MRDSMEPAIRLHRAMQKFHYLGGVVGGENDWDMSGSLAGEWIAARIEFREALKSFLATSDSVLEYE